MHTRVKADIIHHARSFMHEEVCGFVYQTETEASIYPCTNVTTDPLDQAFEIAPDDYIKARDLGRVCGIYHSHVAGAAFSEADLDLAREMCLPMYLYVGDTGEWLDYVPPTYHVPAVGQPFAWGFGDCYETARIHYRQNRDIYLSDFDRDESFERAQESLILPHVEAEGFVRVPKHEPILKDDALLFRMPRSPYPNHLAVVVGPNMMLHHRLRQLSMTEPIDGVWLRRLAGVLRYEGKGKK